MRYFSVLDGWLSEEESNSDILEGDDWDNIMIIIVIQVIGLDFINHLNLRIER